MSEQRAIVVGGGVIGAACAYYLTKVGWQVTIVDREGFGSGCTHGNCGLIALCHVLPLNQPGAVIKAIKAVCTRNSPFRIKPRLDWGLWSWLLKFARRSNERDMLESAKARATLLESSGRLYRQLLADEAIDCEWEDRGCLFVYRTKKEMDDYAETDRLLRERFNLPAERYDGDTLIELEPALKPGLAGGWLYKEDSHLRPDRLMASWRGVLEGMGVTVRENCEAKGFSCTGRAASSLNTTQGEMPADAFVVAAGALTPMLGKQLGCRIPIQPGKGYSITMPRPAVCPKIPMIFQEHKVVVTPMQSGYRLGSTMEFAGYDDSLNRRRLNLLREGARLYLHEPYTEPVEEEWCGWRPMTYDGKPIIDRSPALDNVYIAAGHNMLGLTMAPATGKLIAELLSGQPPHVDTAPFSVTRF